MAKGKSSASSATRKKHQRKAQKANGDDVDDQSSPQQKNQNKPSNGSKKKDKKSRFEPKVKRYIPPPPPPKGKPDPVDVYLQGGSSVDPELVVILRRLHKKDESTLVKGVEGLETWVRDVIRRQLDVVSRQQQGDANNEDDGWQVEQAAEEVVEAMQVWASHFPRLALHPERRVRHQTHLLHALLTSQPPPFKPSPLLAQTRSALLIPMWTEQREYTGAWCCSAFDSDKAVRVTARRSWEAVLAPVNEPAHGESDASRINLMEHASNILDFAAGNIFTDPASSTESHENEHALVRTQSLLAIAYLLSTLPSPLPVPEQSLDLFVSDELWEFLRPTSQPTHVRRAVYELLGAATARTDETLLERDGGLQMISTRVLQYCWAEQEGWTGIIRFLQRYPQAWSLLDQNVDGTRIDSKEGSANGDDEQDEDDDSAEETTAEVDESAAPSSATSTASLPNRVNAALSQFYRHLNLACSGQPQLYPTVLLLLSTIPTNVLRPTYDQLSLLFESFWAAWGGRALSSVVGVAAPGGQPSSSTTAVEDFVTALLESLEFQFTAAVKSDEAESTDVVKQLAIDWFGRLLSTFLGLEGESQRMHSSIATSLVANRMSNFLVRLNEKHASAFNKVWHDVVEGKSADVRAGDSAASLEALSVMLMALSKSGLDAVRSKANDLANDSVKQVATLVQQSADDDAQTAMRLSFLQSTKQACADSPLASESLEIIAKQKIPAQLRNESTSTAAFAFLVDYLSTARQSPRDSVWQSLFETKLPMNIVQQLVQAVQHGSLPMDLPLANLDQRMRNVAQCIVSDDFTSFSIVELEVLMELMAQPRRLLELGHDVPEEAVFGARHAFEQITIGGDERVTNEVLKSLTALLIDTTSRPSPIELVNAAATLLGDVRGPSLSTLLPAIHEFDVMLADLSISSPTPALSILQPLVPQSTEFRTRLPESVDEAGLSAYVRVLLASLEVAARQDHSWARSNTALLYHLLMLSHVASDELASSCGTSGIWGHEVRADVLERIATASNGLSTYMLSAAGNDAPSDWHSKALSAVRAKEPPSQPTGDAVVDLLDRLAREARNEKAVYARRSLKVVLETMLRYSDESVQDAERWLAWAQSLSGASDLACTVVLAIKDVLVESPRLERYQNELAANLSGVSSNQVNSKGLPMLRLLLATAPPQDSSVIFLPQQRAMFLIKSLSGWLASEDDLDEEVYARLAELFVHVCPIVQDLSGSHWDLMFDVLEMNIQAADWEEASTMSALYHSCQLLLTLFDLASSNGELRDITKGRFDKGLQLVRDLFVARPDSKQRNMPRLAILDAMSRLIRVLPSKMLTMNSFDALARLLRDPSLKVQRTAFDLIIKLVESHVTDLVVEVELDSDNALTIALPTELVQLISAKEALKDAEPSAVTTYLLAWLITFRFFESASPRIKYAYNDQLRRADIVASSFLPMIFALVNLSDRTKPVDLSPWAVDEFHLELLDALDEKTLPVFASHTYFRSLQAIPSLIRQWYEACKNRQLSMTFATFTSKHFSPVLIASELNHLRDPDDAVGKSLRDHDDFNVKVAQGAHEVKAVFVVDEESMEISVRLPNEFPLQQVEVREVRKVGVNDEKWRAWLLGIQQVVTNQNGLIADALNVFKRNVVAHFEGVEACAICYSTVHLVDRSLPKKQCKTCSNRFHAACLYKWFSTSHGSWHLAVGVAGLAGIARAQAPQGGTGTQVADQACGWSYQCPDSAPCCTEFGTCSAGVGCLGGCNPIGSLSAEYCAPMPTCSSMNYTFADTSKIQMNLTEFNGDASLYDWTLDHQDNTQTSIVQNNELVLLMTEQGKGTRLSTTRTVLYGQIQASIKTTGAPGVVTALITMSGSKDEIDWEWTSNNTNEVQSNYYWMGDVDGYTHGGQHEADNRDTQYHVYGLNWTPTKLDWLVDGKVVRTLQASNTVNGSLTKFPQTPSRIQMSVWPAGIAGTSQGTIDWAGGMIDWDSSEYTQQGYFASYVQWVSVQCYDGLDLPFEQGNSNSSSSSSSSNSTSSSTNSSRLAKRDDGWRLWERAPSISSYLWGANNTAGQPQVAGSDAGTIINSQYSTGMNMMIKENDTKGVKQGTGSGDLATHAATTWWGRLPTAAKVGIGIGAAAGALFIIVSICTCFVRFRRGGSSSNKAYKQVGNPNAIPLKPTSAGVNGPSAAGGVRQQRLAPQASQTSLASSMRKDDYYDPYAMASSPRDEYDAWSLPQRQHSPAPQYQQQYQQRQQGGGGVGGGGGGAQHFYGGNYNGNGSRTQLPRGYSGTTAGGYQTAAWQGDVGAQRAYGQQPQQYNRGHY
ncbi:hypothetical protein OIO90_000004 [Microbotryomycetes sp. JL221]|nr:hypothetical protein OIO90_000004 [Microbotryomycetes sp. JL221]